MAEQYDDSSVEVSPLQLAADEETGPSTGGALATATQLPPPAANPGTLPSSTALDTSKQEYSTALQKMMDTLNKRQGINWFSVAGEFLNPGRTGSFGEGLGNAAANIGKQQQEQQKNEPAVAMMRAQLAEKKFGLDKDALVKELVGSLYKKEKDPVTNQETYTINPAAAQQLASLTGDVKYQQLAIAGQQQVAGKQLFNSIFKTTTTTDANGNQVQSAPKLDFNAIKAWAASQTDPMKAMTGVTDMYRKTIQSGFFSDVQQGKNPFDSIVVAAKDNPLLLGQATYWQQMYSTLEPEKAATIAAGLTKDLLDTDAHTSGLGKLQNERTRLLQDNADGKNTQRINEINAAIHKETNWAPKEQISDEDLLPTAQEIANYKLPPPPVGGRAGGTNAKTMKLVTQINPDYDIMAYKARQGDITALTAMKKDMAGTTPNSTGSKIQVFNAATNHLDLMAQLVTGLKNNDIRMINGLKNEFKTAFGNADVTNFETIKPIVIREILKAISANGGSVDEAKRMGDTLASKNSPDQLLGSITQYRDLMKGQLDAIHGKYVRNFNITDPAKDDFGTYLSGRAQKLTGYVAPAGTPNAQPGAPAASISKADQNLIDQYLPKGGH